HDVQTIERHVTIVPLADVPGEHSLAIGPSLAAGQRCMDRGYCNCRRQTSHPQDATEARQLRCFLRLSSSFSSMKSLLFHQNGYWKIIEAAKGLLLSPFRRSEHRRMVGRPVFSLLNSWRLWPFFPAAHSSSCH